MIALVSAIVQRVTRQIRVLSIRINDIVVEKIAIFVLVTVELRPGTYVPVERLRPFDWMWIYAVVPELQLNLALFPQD